MAVLSQFTHRSGTLLRRFGLELAISAVAFVVVAFLVSRALPSADPSRFDRGDAAWVGELARTVPDPARPPARPTSASLTVAPGEAGLPTASAPAVKPARLAAAPTRRAKPADTATEPVAPAPATPVPVAATSPDFFDLSRVTSRLPSREALLRPFDAVGSTVAGFFRRP